VIDVFLKSEDPFQALPPLAHTLAHTPMDSVFRLPASDVAINYHEPLGSGNFASVFRGTYKGQAVAVKVMHISMGDEAGVGEEVARAFVLSEVACNRLLASDASGLLPCYGAALLPPSHACGHDCRFCPSTGTYWRVALVSKLCTMGTLKNFISAAKSLREDQLPAFYLLLAELMSQLATAMHGMHNQGLLHRDLKGENILLAVVEGGMVRGYVGDLGCMAGVGSRATTRYQAGTTDMMAPEVSFHTCFRVVVVI
jgi:serine/threonine protein kinase